MDIIPYSLLGAGLVAVLSVIWMALRLRGYRGEHEPDQMVEFSPARYQPMARLLEEDDIEFLAAQPGYRTEIGAKLRRERRSIFRMYLRELARDFQSLHAQARAVVAESGEQHSELVGILMRQQVAFWRSLAGLELQLALRDLGIGRVDASGLVAAVEAMRMDLERFAPAAA